jgi:hypothetical protein
MAIIQNELAFSSSPPFKTIIEAVETGRTSTNATFKITMKLKLNSSTSSAFYGYAINWRATLNGVSSGLLKVKAASPRWYGGEAYRTFTTTLTTSVGVTGGTIPLKIEMLPSGGGNISFNKTYNIAYSTWNTPPVLSGVGSINKTGIIPENTSSIIVSWEKAVDSNLSGYIIYRYVDKVHKATIEVGADVTQCTDDISEYGQGSEIYYKVWAVDSYGEKSEPIASNIITLNTLTGASLTINNSIDIDTNVINASFKGASNTDGNITFKYTVYSDQITVYNGNVAATPFTVKIWRTGETVPTTPYIKFDDLKKFADSSYIYQRTLTLKLKTTNDYGSSTTKSATVDIDLRANPTPPTQVNITGKVSLATGGSYFIPDRQDITVAWSGASDKLGGSLTYDLLGKLGTGSFTTLKSNISTTSTTVTLPRVSAETGYIFRVVAKTSYGRQSTKDAVQIQLHSYKAPSIEFTEVNRTAEGVSLKVVTKANTTIPNVGFSKRVYTGVVSGNLTTSPQILSKTGLDSGSKYSLTVTVKDDTGLSNEVVKSLTINQYTPIMSVREKGVGVNCIPDGSAKFMVDGSVLPRASITGLTSTQNVPLGLSIASTSDGSAQGYPSSLGLLLSAKDSNYRQLQIFSTHSSNDLWFRTGHLESTGGTAQGTREWQKIYHSGNKPTAAEIGASPVNHTHTGYATANHTHTGYASSNHTHPYLPLTGGTIDGDLSVTENIVSLKSINIGAYEDVWRGVIMYRSTGTQKYLGRLCAGHSSIKLTSSASANTVYGGVIESHNSSKTMMRYLFGNTAFVPLTDSSAYCGTSSNRWASLYASTGTVYSSSKDEKADIVPVEQPQMARNDEESSYSDTKDLIVDGIKNTPLYSYKYRTLNNDDTFVGFLGQELEEQNKAFFDLIGTSYVTDEGIKQYDVRELSVLGVLWTGLQDALNTIDDLKREIKELKELKQAQ